MESLQDLRESVVRLEGGRCDEQAFCELSERAVTAYRHQPQLGEQIAYLMSSVWALSHDTWVSAPAEQLGQLFADLEVPPYHVQGGEAGAQAKWSVIERLVNSTQKNRAGENPPDSQLPKSR